MVNYMSDNIKITRNDIENARQAFNKEKEDINKVKNKIKKASFYNGCSKSTGEAADTMGEVNRLMLEMADGLRDLITKTSSFLDEAEKEWFGIDKDISKKF